MVQFSWLMAISLMAVTSPTLFMASIPLKLQWFRTSFFPGHLWPSKMRPKPTVINLLFPVLTSRTSPCQQAQDLSPILLPLPSLAPLNFQYPTQKICFSLFLASSSFPFFILFSAQTVANFQPYSLLLTLLHPRTWPHPIPLQTLTKTLIPALL